LFPKVEKNFVANKLAQTLVKTLLLRLSSPRFFWYFPTFQHSFSCVRLSVGLPPTRHSTSLWCMHLLSSLMSLPRHGAEEEEPPHLSEVINFCSVHSVRETPEHIT
jgi:hypothetical protein